MSTNANEKQPTEDEVQTHVLESNIEPVLTQEDEVNKEPVPEVKKITVEAEVKDLPKSSERIKMIMDTLDGKEELITYSSDELEALSSSDDSSDSSDSEESSSDDDSSDSDSDNDLGLEGTVRDGEGALSNKDEANFDDDLDEEQTGPISSKNEIVDEEAPTLPEDFKIDSRTPLEYIGEVISAVEKSVIVRANISGEFRVLKENSVLCFEDRTLLGPLFEVFGRLQAPFYRVKFNSDSKILDFKEKIGAKVFYVVPDSQFVYTDAIKAIKATDASNWNDEEVPEEEQEFSDDEKEAAFKSKNKKKKKNSKQTVSISDTKRPSKSEHSGPARKIAQYEPIYADKKPATEVPLQKPLEPALVPQPQDDPLLQMLKLQQQFMNIHNKNLNRTRTEPHSGAPANQPSQRNAVQYQQPPPQNVNPNYNQPQYQYPPSQYNAPYVQQPQYQNQPSYNPSYPQQMPPQPNFYPSSAPYQQYAQPLYPNQLGQQDQRPPMMNANVAYQQMPPQQNPYAAPQYQQSNTYGQNNNYYPPLQQQQPQQPQQQQQQTYKNSNDDEVDY